MKTGKERITEEVLKDVYLQGLSSRENTLVCRGIYLVYEKTRQETQEAEVFVKHIENHLTELIKEGKLNKDAKVMCKICNKDIEEIYKEELKKKFSEVK